MCHSSTSESACAGKRVALPGADGGGEKACAWGVRERCVDQRDCNSEKNDFGNCGVASNTCRERVPGPGVVCTCAAGGGGFLDSTFPQTVVSVRHGYSFEVDKCIADPCLESTCGREHAANKDGAPHSCERLQPASDGAQEATNRPNIEWQEQIHRGILRGSQKYF